MRHQSSKRISPHRGVRYAALRANAFSARSSSCAARRRVRRGGVCLAASVAIVFERVFERCAVRASLAVPFAINCARFASAAQPRPAPSLLHWHCRGIETKTLSLHIFYKFPKQFVAGESPKPRPPPPSTELHCNFPASLGGGGNAAFGADTRRCRAKKICSDRPSSSRGPPTPPP